MVVSDRRAPATGLAWDLVEDAWLNATATTRAAATVRAPSAAPARRRSGVAGVVRVAADI